MRAVLLGLGVALIAVARAAAAPIVIDFGIREVRRDLSHPTPQIPVPVTLSFAVKPNPNPMLSVFAWDVDAGQSDVGQDWELNPLNSEPTLWASLQSAFATPSSWFFRTGLGSPLVSFPFSGQWPQPTPAERYIITELQSLTVILHELISSPLGSIVRWQHIVSGEGQIVPVPEPTCISMAWLAVPYLIVRARAMGEALPNATKVPAVPMCILQAAYR
ncbi:MAG TPA: hypothetical protein PKC18_14760 [Lacipirellulaceae bacterium]|nr:hypothetical protein [Lacipirellulaceae bacterium]HMP05822.1 hypothetical protein [Lacipirellulaceae bacterium]